MFILRLLSSIILISIVLFSIFSKSELSSLVFIIFGSILAFLAIKEFLQMIAKVGKKSFILPAMIVGTLILISIFLNRSYKFNITYMIMVFSAVLSWILMLFSIQRKSFIDKIINSTSAIFIIILPLTFLAEIYIIAGDGGFLGRYLLFFLIAVTKSGDMGAYVIGTLTNKLSSGGNRKIVPSISPKKSWEGTLGGFAVSIIVAYLLSGMLPQAKGTVLSNETLALIFGALLFVGGFFGDLAESSLKRACGVKDSGRTIPGIGGILDLLDSLIINAPLFYYCIYLIYFM